MYWILTICLMALQLLLIIALILRHLKDKTSELELRALTRHFLRGQEEERKRIARELHDDFGQRLALLKMDIETGMRKGPPLRPEEGQPRMQRILSQIDELNTDIQHLSHSLHSSKLQYLGLKSALKSLCDQVGKQHPIEIAFEADYPGTGVSKEIELCLYRVAQEALHNIVKHSKAGRAVVQLTHSGPVLRMEIRDDGNGFSPVEKSKGMGLVSMRERLCAFGGELEIESAPAGGTTLCAQVLLRGSEKHGPSKSS